MILAYKDVRKKHPRSGTWEKIKYKSRTEATKEGSAHKGPSRVQSFSALGPNRALYSYF